MKPRAAERRSMMRGGGNRSGRETTRTALARAARPSPEAEGTDVSDAVMRRPGRGGSRRAARGRMLTPWRHVGRKDGPFGIGQIGFITARAAWLRAERCPSLA